MVSFREHATTILQLPTTPLEDLHGRSSSHQLGPLLRIQRFEASSHEDVAAEEMRETLQVSAGFGEGRIMLVKQ